MSADKIYVAILLSPDDDWPSVDLVYDGEHWASVFMRDGELRVTVYGSDTPVPMDDAIASLEEARRRLLTSLTGGEAATAD